MMKYWINKFLIISSLAALLAVVCIVISDILVKASIRKKVFNSVQNIPKNKVGLLLGTAKFLQSGEPNLYYKYRVEAAVELLNAGKVEFILVSGDNSTKYYDEPSTFETDLIEAGIPADKMYKDYAGFRTLDSIVRSKEVFGQSSITVISQPFHNERAIYIATRKGIDAIGYNSERVIAEYGLKCRSESVWPA
jgi:SanA protein